MHRVLAPCLLMLAVAACGGGAAPAASPTEVAVATTLVTPKPTAAPVATTPPPTPIPGCLPACWTGRLTRPGALSGDYTTKYFFGGQLTLTVPDGWFGYEDSTGELSIGRPNDDETSMQVWIDVYAAQDPSGTQLTSVARTGEAVVAWFVEKPIIDVLKRAPTTVGGIPAEAIEYRRNATAATDDPACPAEFQPCSVAFGFPEWDGAFGEGSPFHSKLVVANAVWGGQAHTIYVVFAATDSTYDALIEKVDAVIASIRLPDGVGPAT